ncbi:MAG TPA: hypothetical protein VFF85_03845 [Microbacterium sp.]|nr:hypothetical protein [Microbacterium sp.]
MSTLLLPEVSRHLERAPKGWYTESRAKTEESFYQKIETGNVPDFDRMEDFVGVFIVVPLPTDLPEALKFVEGFLEERYRKPASDKISTLRATEFPFNDIRIYGNLRPDESLPRRPLDEVVFEIQVKTFFQHAWSTATHDLVYKHGRFSWPRSRVAAQLKAILEHAELSMAALDQLETSPVIYQTGSPERELSEYHTIASKHWPVEDLPANQKRMTETIHALCLDLNLTPSQLDELLTRGRNDLMGHPIDWSPYQCIIDYASRYVPDNLRRALRRRRGATRIIHITPEVLQRLGLTRGQAVNGRL